MYKKQNLVDKTKNLYIKMYNTFYLKDGNTKTKLKTEMNIFK